MTQKLFGGDMMKTHRFLFLILALLIFAAPALAQDESRLYNNSNLNNLSTRLTQQATRLREQVYRDYANRSINSSTDTTGVILAYQFNGAADAFRQMVQDRRRWAEMRDAAELLNSMAQNGNNYSFRSRWYDVQRTMTDIQNEFNRGGGGGYPGPGGGYPGPGGGTSAGTIRWRGTVDDVVELHIHGGDVDTRAISGTPYNDATVGLTEPLPNRSANVTVRKLRGRGDVRVIQQPNRSNGFTAIVQVRDPNRGADSYDLEINWSR
jgi:hypothetical protein